MQYGPNGLHVGTSAVFDPATEMYSIAVWPNRDDFLYLRVPPEPGVYELADTDVPGRARVSFCSFGDPQVGCSLLRGSIRVTRSSFLGDARSDRTWPNQPFVFDLAVDLSGTRVPPSGNNATTVELPVTGRIETCIDREHSGTGCQQVSGGSLVTGKDRGEANDTGGISGGTSPDTATLNLRCPGTLPSGYQCLSRNGQQAPGRFSLPALHGTWVESSREVCMTLGSGGTASFRYRSGFPAETRPWGALVSATGQLQPSASAFYVSTGSSDAQIALLTWNGSGFSGYAFQRGSCPW